MEREKINWLMAEWFFLFNVGKLQPFHEGDAWDMVIEPNHQEWEKLIKGEVEKGKSCLDRKYK